MRQIPVRQPSGAWKNVLIFILSVALAGFIWLVLEFSSDKITCVDNYINEDGHVHCVIDQGKVL